MIVWNICRADVEADEHNDDDDASSEETELDWQIEQEPFSATVLPLDGPKYGFANQRCGILQRLQVRQLTHCQLLELTTEHFCSFLSELIVLVMKWPKAYILVKLFHFMMAFVNVARLLSPKLDVVLLSHL